MVRSRLKSKALKNTLLRWHRRAGVSAAFFVLLLAITGILLNHSNSLHFDRQSISSPFILKLYGITPPPIVAYKLGTGSAEQIGHKVSLNGKPISDCDGTLVGAVKLAELSLLACTKALLLITPKGELVEQITPLQGLPTPITGLGLCQHDACLITPSKNFVANVDALEFTPTQQVVKTELPVNPNPKLRQTLVSHYTGGGITWARLIQDLHAGRFLGGLGPWLMDAIALLFILLAVSGVYLWWRGGRRHK